ncbi:MAG TPA: zinc-binding alcohol dehydrogenase, partial [Stellaceae bacterium]|nr:zinc-binding alcohol dehydrogenase [Stellaceae bacterium]
PDDVMIRTAASAISRGTESLVFRGRVPPSEYQQMRCPFQDGDFPAPVKYGYASVGVVEAGQAALQGRRVFCLYPHQDRYIVPASAVVPVPASVPDERATLAANMETAVNAMWDAGPRIGDRIAVIGAGVVGCFIASLAAKLPGTRIELIDIDRRRAPLAEALGCRFAQPDDATGECDIVFHSSASEAGLATALRLAGFEAKLIELSWYGDKQVAVPLGASFHQRRLRLISSQVGAVAPARRARRTHRDRLALALALLVDPLYDQLISGHCTLDTLPQRMAQLAAAPDGALAEIVLYR